MLTFALRNLLHERTRLLISSGGVALAVLLILFMRGIFIGAEEHAVAFIRNQAAPLWLMQEGVENMHMASSLLPADAVTRVRQVAGVADASGLLYTTGAIDAGDDPIFSYIFAVDPAAPIGSPWEMMAGSPHPGLDEVVLDGDLARRHGLELGDQVNLFGYDLTISGLSKGTFGIATSITWVNNKAMAGLMGVSPEAASYILVRPEPGVDLAALAATLGAAVPEANILTQEAFIASDQEMIRQMGADIIRAMNAVAYVVGLLVISLTIYTATVERAREYAVLKAIGASAAQLTRTVFVQAFASSGLGFLLGALLTYAVAAVVQWLLPDMLVLIRLGDLLRELPVLMLVAALAALLPLSRVLRLDPMVVFRS